ncbi:coenzyme A transporter [Dimargaris xerosporica]|nr:coenzyme A transporter [Dimargaris xerosporica]
MANLQRDLPVAAAPEPCTKTQFAPTKSQSSLDPVYIFKTLLAGGVAGCAAKTSIAPLDRVKILFQANQPNFQKYAGSLRGVLEAGREIVHSRGIQGLFQGHSITILRIFPYSAIKFMAFEQFKLRLMPIKELDTRARHFVVGSLAGTTSVIFTYPLDLIRVRLAYDTTNGAKNRIAHALQGIYREPTYRHGLVKHPLTNFYRGFAMTLVGMVPYAGASFYTYESLRRLCQDHYFEWTMVTPAPTTNGASDSTKPQLRAWAKLFCGGVAGAVAQTVSYPAEVVRRRIQVAGVTPSPLLVSPLAVAAEIYAERGLRGFYVGLSIGYLKVTPMMAVAFCVYEYMKELLDIT